MPIEVLIAFRVRRTEQTHTIRKLIVLSVLAASIAQAQADDRRSDRSSKNRNYLLRRQQAYQVQGVPTDRLIIGKRELDIYPNGLIFEKNNVVGVRQGR